METTKYLASCLTPSLYILVRLESEYFEAASLEFSSSIFLRNNRSSGLKRLTTTEFLIENFGESDPPRIACDIVK